MKKALLLALGIIAILGVVVVLNLGGAVRKTIEVVGSKTLGTPVRVGRLDISLASKSASLSGLSIKNPGGFKADTLLQTKGIAIKIGAVDPKLVTIDEIVVDGMSVTYELGARGSNLDAIKKNLGSSAPADKTATGAEGTKLVIQKLKIINAQLIPAIGAAQTPVPLPDIVLSNIGSKGSPAEPAQVAAQIINKVLAAASAGVLKAGLNAPVGGAVDKAKEGVKSLKGLLPR